MKADIVDIISGYIPLRKIGRNFKALCPFHSEKTPSFIVSPAKQIYHCFGCGEGGNVFNFVMKLEHLEFPEAAGKIADKVGVKIPTTDYRDRKEQSVFNQLYEINEIAEKFYNSVILISIWMNKYFKKVLADNVFHMTVKVFQRHFCHRNYHRS